LITKAYEALTNELARANWEKYGNPDGPGPMQIAIGLPKFLLEAENAVPALIVAFLFILIVIPFLFFVWYNKSLKSDDLRCL